MNSQEIIGCNVKWWRYQKNITQEQLAIKANMKLTRLSRIECGRINLTCSSIDALLKTLDITLSELCNEETALKAKKLPKRVDNYLPSK